MKSVDSRDAIVASGEPIDLNQPRSGDPVNALMFDASDEARAERSRLFTDRMAMKPWRPSDGFAATYDLYHSRRITVIPQDRGQRRQPARPAGYGRLTYKEFFNKAHHQSIGDLRNQSGYLSSLNPNGFLIPASRQRPLSGDNVAILAGKPSGGLSFIDVDVSSLSLSIEVERRIERRLGSTPVKRVGNQPRIMLAYRIADGQDIEKISAIRFEGSSDQVEFLVREVLVTWGGAHYKTGHQFLFGERHLLDMEPHEVSTIKYEDLLDLKADLLEYFAATTKGSIVADDVDPADLADLPRELGTPGQLDRLPPDYRDLGDRKVSAGGRRKFLRSLTCQLACTNPIGEALIRDRKSLQAWSRQLAWLALQLFDRHADRTDEWASDGVVMKQAVELTMGALRKVAAGDIPRLDRRRPQKPGNVATPIPRVPAEVFRRDPRARLNWLSSRDYRPSAIGQFEPVEGATSLEAIVLARREREIQHDRSDLADQINGVTVGMVDAYLAAISDATEAGVLRVVRSDPGSGKTSRAARHLITRIREIDPESKIAKVKLDDGCIVFMVRSYINAHELLTHMSKAGARILLCTDEVPGPRPEGEVRVGLLVGKSTAGCALVGALDAMNKAGLPAKLACREELDVAAVAAAWELQPNAAAGTTVTNDCWYRENGQCRFYRQEKIFASCQVIVCVQSYLSAKAPAWLTPRVRGIIIDEDPTMNLLVTKALKIADFDGGRRDGQVTATLRGAGIETVEQVEKLRARAVRIVLEALRNDRDAAADLLAIKEERAGRPPLTGETLLAAARACVAPIQATKDGTTHIRPLRHPDHVDQHAAELIAYAKSNRTPAGLMAERLLWTVIASRMDLLKTGKAKGLIDARLQLRQPEAGKYKVIRISHRKTPNFQGLPTLILDASAQAPVLEKLFNATVEDKKVRCNLNLRVVADVDQSYANSRFQAHDNDSRRAWEKKELLITRIRLALTHVAHRFAPDRVLFVATRAVADIILKRWNKPANVDVMYFGNLRGHDAAKSHAALVSVGRLELSPDANDAYMDALGFDDEIQPKRMDPRGDSTGKHDVADRVLTLRNGHTLLRKVPAAKSERGRQIEFGFREQELVQTAGRLRCVHRTGVAPLWLAFTSCMPADFVVDQVIRLEDIAAVAGAADEARKAGAITSNKAALPFPKKLTPLAKPADARRAEEHVARIRRENADLHTAEVERLADEAMLRDRRLLTWDKAAPKTGVHGYLFEYIGDPETIARMGFDLAELDAQADAIWSIADDIGETLDRAA